MKKYTSKSTAETESIAAEFAASVKAGDVVALYGDLGAGKTAFVRGLARGLGFFGEVSSPTFAIVHEYDGKIPIAHFDMYRINGWDDIYSTGFFDYLEGRRALAIEWSENITEFLPDKYYKVTISADGSDEERELVIDHIGA